MSSFAGGGRKPRVKKSVLIAAVGVASVTFVGCPGVSLGNLVAPPPCTSADTGGYCYPPYDSGVAEDAGARDDAAVDAGSDAGTSADASADDASSPDR